MVRGRGADLPEVAAVSGFATGNQPCTCASMLRVTSSRVPFASMTTKLPTLDPGPTVLLSLTWRRPRSRLGHHPGTVCGSRLCSGRGRRIRVRGQD